MTPAEAQVVGELHDRLAELARGETCDHSVNICWCGVFDALDAAAELLGRPKETRR